MKVPEGFTVELVAAEPDIVNPVAMTFDERGRIWITESIEYPRHQAGPGRDRVKVLESTRGDGRYDKITVFADGLNIPSGIAVGHGGVWVANAPDILYYPEVDGKAGKPEVVVTGFGRSDTHELPNSLTWGPDGCLYGLNGVFNPSVIKQRGKEFAFTCALFRIDPRTRNFDIFCEGTSNPWGLAFDTEGSSFVSACVIDHLWHLTETGYYLRQGGPYPPFTWKLDSIVKHKHQKAAYCGLHYFDSDAYPAEFRDKLYMGNIHGGCINVDVLQRDGSTYLARPAPDFLTANDAWFMPVSQKTGPDGCLYILDWYDRYHCYQDANRDPAGIDREHGRLYRVRYKDTPPAGKFDLKKESDDELIRRLHSPNIYFRDIAQRLLCERNTPAIRARLQQLVLDDKALRKARLAALWSLIGTGALDARFQLDLLSHPEPAYRAWAVRAAGNFRKVDPAIRERVVALAKDPSADVKLQVVIAARKLEGLDALPVLMEVLENAGGDRVIPAIVWQNLHPLLEDHADAFLRIVAKTDSEHARSISPILPRVVERLVSRQNDPAPLAALFHLLLDDDKIEAEITRQCLGALAARLQTGEVTTPQVTILREHLQPALKKLLGGKPGHTLYFDAALVAAMLRDREGIEVMRKAFADSDRPAPLRLKAITALVAAGDSGALEESARVLADPGHGSVAFRGDVLAALGKLDDPRVAEVVLAGIARMEPELRPRAIELLTERPAWGKRLLRAIADNKVSASTLNVNQLRNLLHSKDPELARLAREKLGVIREERNPEREKVVAEMRTFLQKNRGDPKAGRRVFRTVCAQCHRIYGEGQDVGPDITADGRGSFESLLSNVFDPSLVIGASYQATYIQTTKGRSLTGLVVEDSPQRVLLKLQGGKVETILRAEIEEMSISKVSLMPEGFEKQLKQQEIVDLFAFLTLDRPPEDANAKPIPGTPR